MSAADVRSVGPELALPVTPVNVFPLVPAKSMRPSNLAAAKVFRELAGSAAVMKHPFESTRGSQGGGKRTLMSPNAWPFKVRARLGSLFSSPITASIFASTLTVTESRAPDGALFGDDATDALLSTAVESADSLLQTLLDAVHAHAAGEPAADDVTLLAVRRA